MAMAGALVCAYIVWNYDVIVLDAGPAGAGLHLRLRRHCLGACGQIMPPIMGAAAFIMATVIISWIANNWKATNGASYAGRRVEKELWRTSVMNVKDVLSAMENGGLALGVAAACACTGFVIGVVTLTGLGLKLAQAIMVVSGDSFALPLVLTMLASIVLGMGLPTTAKDIVLATIAAPAIMHFGVPALAAHLFIMYFDILADLTPPRGPGRLCRPALPGRTQCHWLHGRQAGAGGIPHSVHLLLQSRSAHD